MSTLLKEAKDKALINLTTNIIAVTMLAITNVLFTPDSYDFF
jgi:hypothetical protein